MLHLAVGRSPVRARRPSHPVGCLTDASLAAFDLLPEDLDNTATASTVQAGDFDHADTDFSLPQFDLQT